MSDKQRRSKRYIDPPVQRSLARRIILHWVVFFAAATTVTFLLHFCSNPFQPLSGHLRELWWSQGPSFVVMLCLLPIFVFDGIKLSNRFAGPIARLRTAIDDLTQGKPHDLDSFREGDFWKTLASDFNNMISRLTKQQQSSGGSSS